MKLPHWALMLPVGRIRLAASKYGINSNLLIALVMTESSGNPAATRYEAHTDKYLVDPDYWSEKLGIPLEEEINCQKTSWGLCQVMGFVARELGYEFHLRSIKQPEVGLDLGAKKLAHCLERWPLWDEALAAYNGGSPRKDKYGHLEPRLESYVKKVYVYLKELDGKTPREQL